MNVYDSEKLALILESCGFEQTRDMDRADVVVCNTCSIRQKAQDKAFSFLGLFAKSKKVKPHMIIVMAGCVAQQEGGNAFKRLPHLDIVLGTKAFERFGQHIENFRSGQRKIVDTEGSEEIFEILPDKFSDSRVSRFVTIMQGCENYCTYCVVPYVRGAEKSRKPENIIKEIRLLAESGVREITLLGQNVNSYGCREKHMSFADLLEKISRIEEIKRIRFATSHPKDLSDDLIFAIRDLEKVCNHLHLPVQSGSDKILKKMNRGYTRRTYTERIFKLRENCPGIGISTDMIVGFPHETEKDFNDTLDLLDEVRFDSLFAFAYSDRSIAPASKFSHQVDEKEKFVRLNKLLDLQENYTRKIHEQLVGTHMEVLVEGKSARKREGFESESPDVDQMTGRTSCNKIVHFPVENAQPGDLVSIRIEKAYPHSLWGTPSGI